MTLENFYIENYDVDMVVNKNKSVAITENIDVYFTSSSHGIFRDIPYKNYTGNLAENDFVVFGNVGGYSNVDKPPFISPQCAMIGINSKEIYLIKRKENVQDIISTYII